MHDLKKYFINKNLKCDVPLNSDPALLELLLQVFRGVSHRPAVRFITALTPGIGCTNVYSKQKLMFQF